MIIYKNMIKIFWVENVMINPIYIKTVDVLIKIKEYIIQVFVQTSPHIIDLTIRINNIVYIQ